MALRLFRSVQPPVPYHSIECSDGDRSPPAFLPYSFHVDYQDYAETVFRPTFDLIPWPGLYASRFFLRDLLLDIDPLPSGFLFLWSSLPPGALVQFFRIPERIWSLALEILSFLFRPNLLVREVFTGPHSDPISEESNENLSFPTFGPPSSVAAVLSLDLCPRS